MKYRFTQLSIGQKALALIQAAMLLLFLILYSTIGRIQYIDFRGEHLRYTTAGQTQIYSGQVNHTDVSITVEPDQSVTFQLDDTVYGPYIIVEDPTAVADKDLLNISSDLLTGIEIRTGNEMFFRGGYRLSDSLSLLLFDEEGSMHPTISISGSGISTEPKPSEILRIALNPQPAARAHVYGFLFGALFNLATVLLILYADEQFRFSLRFRIENAEDAEPSEWELFSRWIGWFAFTVCALVIYIIGLNNF